jgi:putative redox protein
MASSSERLSFVGALGEKLTARLDAPAGAAKAFAIFAHCFTCSKDYKSVLRISRVLADHAVAVLRFDFTGLGESRGDFADTNFSTNLQDLLAAAEFLRRHYQPPNLLIGHSLGGAAVLTAARRIEEVKAVATIAAPSDTQHLGALLVMKAPQVKAEGMAEVEIGGRTLRIKRQLLDDLESHSVLDAAAALGRALLVFHAPEDRVVPLEHAERLFEAAAHPKSFIALDGADHLLSREDDALYVGRLLAAWFERYRDA